LSPRDLTLKTYAFRFSVQAHARPSANRPVRVPKSYPTDKVFRILQRKGQGALSPATAWLRRGLFEQHRIGCLQKDNQHTRIDMYKVSGVLTVKTSHRDREKISIKNITLCAGRQVIRDGFCFFIQLETYMYQMIVRSGDGVFLSLKTIPCPS